MEAPKRGVVTHGRLLAKIAKDVIHSSLNCEKLWNEYIGDLRGSVDWSRFIRINPEIDDVPKLDEVHRMKILQETVRTRMQDDPVIKKVAARLVCSSFYFELVGAITEESPTKFTATGSILCRLIPNSKQTEALGWYIHNHSRPGDTPAIFTIQEKGGANPDNMRQVPLSRSILDRMIMHQVFKLPTFPVILSSRVGTLEISLSLDQSVTFPISGFPRCIFLDEKQMSARHRSVNANPNRWAARSRSTQMRRLRWEPPKESDLQRHGSFATYKNQARVLGDASAEEISSMTESLTNGPSPPPNPQPDSPVKLIRATRFFSRTGKKIQREPAPTSNPSTQAVDTAADKSGTQHWYSNLLRRSPRSRSAQNQMGIDHDKNYQGPAELESTSFVGELMADQQQPVELPAEPVAHFTYNKDPLQDQVPSQPDTLPPPVYETVAQMQTVPQPSGVIHAPIPLLMRRPPTEELSPFGPAQSYRSVSPMDSAMTARTNSVRSPTPPSPVRHSASVRRPDLPTPSNWEHF
jgi:hypothetical protein